MAAQTLKRARSRELLGEPLPFIKADSDADLVALDAYRMDYEFEWNGAIGPIVTHLFH